MVSRTFGWIQDAGKNRMCKYFCMSTAQTKSLWDSTAQTNRLWDSQTLQTGKFVVQLNATKHFNPNFCEKTGHTPN